MEDIDLLSCLDWDPCYLETIFSVDFFDMSDLWNTENVTDSELLEMVEKSDVYNPILEDITLDDEELCRAVTAIENK